MANTTVWAAEKIIIIRTELNGNFAGTHSYLIMVFYQQKGTDDKLNTRVVKWRKVLNQRRDKTEKRRFGMLTEKALEIAKIDVLFNFI